MSTEKDSPDSSDMKEAFASAKSVKHEELEKLLVTEKPFTIVSVEDMENTPFVLIGDDDPKGYRLWIMFNGESKDELTAICKWHKQAKELYESKARSTDEMDYLRRVLVSFATIEPLLEDQVFSRDLFGMCIAGVAKAWYDADHADAPKKDLKSFDEARDECMPYLKLVNIYVERLTMLMTSIRSASCEE